jgi:hypothetical protein
MLVGGQSVNCSCLHEDGRALPNRDQLPFDLQDAGTLEHDVELVVFVRLLAIERREARP